MKKILLIVVFLLILAAIPLTLFLVKQRQDIRQRAVPATQVYLEPATVSVAPGDTFTVDVMIKTGENLVSAAELHLSFNSTYLEAQSIANGAFLENVLVEGAVENGTASITLGSSPSEPKQTVGDIGEVLATLTFKALAETSALNPPTTKIEFLNTTQVAGVGEGAVNVLIGSQPAEVTISSAGASPSPSAGASASPSPSGSVTPSPSSSTSPTPNPSGQQTRIIAPANGSTTTNRRIPIGGDSFPNALIVLSVSNGSTNVITTTFYADSTGDWTFTPTSDLANGTYTITVTGESSTGVTETVTSTFTVADSTGGTNPSTSPSASAAASPTLAASTLPSASSSGIPVTGTSTPTLFLFVIAALLITLGVGATILPRF